MSSRTLCGIARRFHSHSHSHSFTPGQRHFFKLSSPPSLTVTSPVTSPVTSTFSSTAVFHSSSSTSTASSFPSRKETLQQIPHSKYKPILSHIENIGVGIRPNQGKQKHKHKHKHKYKQKTKKKNKSAASKIVYSDEGHAYTSNHAHSQKTLSPREEDFYFAKRPSRRHRHQRIRPKSETRSRSSSSKDGKIYKAWGKYKPSNTASDNDGNSHCWWMPPPPFAASSDVFYEDRTKAGYQIKRLPVKILGSSSVQTVQQSSQQSSQQSQNDRFNTDIHTFDEMIQTNVQRIYSFPRGSKHLPEVAIAGRSNVGKSTLLNALLYGNQMRGIDGKAPENRKYQRGITPTFAKLPKGAKAITSNKPGETTNITFYQLTSEIFLPNTTIAQPSNPQSNEQSNEQSKHPQTMSTKMSLLLADLPGYGFALTSPEKAQEWRDMMKDYIIHRGKSLKRVLLLLDARHGIKAADVDFLMHLQHDLQKENYKNNTKQQLRRDLPPIQIILTKCDLVPQIDLARRVIQVREELSDILIREPSSLPVMLVSAKAGLGFNNIRHQRALGGVLELQRELSALVPEPVVKT